MIDQISSKTQTLECIKLGFGRLKIGLLLGIAMNSHYVRTEQYGITFADSSNGSSQPNN